VELDRAHARHQRSAVKSIRHEFMTDDAVKERASALRYDARDELCLRCLVMVPQRYQQALQSSQRPAFRVDGGRGVIGYKVATISRSYGVDQACCTTPPTDAQIDEIIAMCDGDLRDALRVLILVNSQLERREGRACFETRRASLLDIRLEFSSHCRCRLELSS
jgi:hypothetical protein